MTTNWKPMPVIVSGSTILSMELLKQIDSIISNGIEYTIGIMTVVYLFKKIKNVKNEKN